MRQYLTLRDSKDEKMRGARVNLEADRKWSVQETAMEAELRLKQTDFVRNVAVWKLVLEAVHRPEGITADNEVERKLVQKEVRVMVKNLKIVKAVCTNRRIKEAGGIGKQQGTKK